MLYSPSSRGFYVEGMIVPDDAVQITAERHAELIAGQDAGQEIVPGPDGLPVLISPRPDAAACRAERNQRLAASDWMVIRSIETGEPLPSEVIRYRQALRDVPQQPGFPDTIKWPD